MPKSVPSFDTLARRGGRPGIARSVETRGSALSRGYDARWNRARLAFLRSNPLCVICRARGRIIAATCVDHIIPHRGDRRIFWDRSNWQSLCATCHSTKTRFEMGACLNCDWDPRPGWFVVVGEPGSGKTTWVEEHKETDAIVWDFDVEAVRRGFTPVYPRPKNQVDVLLADRGELVRRLEADPDRYRSVFIIVSGNKAAREIARRIRARIVPIYCPESVRRKRVEARPLPLE